MPTATRTTPHPHFHTCKVLWDPLSFTRGNPPVDACFGYTRRERRHDDTTLECRSRAVLLSSATNSSELEALVSHGWDLKHDFRAVAWQVQALYTRRRRTTAKHFGEVVSPVAWRVQQRIAEHLVDTPVPQDLQYGRPKVFSQDSFQQLTSGRLVRDPA